MIINRFAQRKARAQATKPVAGTPRWSCESEICRSMPLRTWPLQVHTTGKHGPIIARVSDCPICGTQRPLRHDEQARVDGVDIQERVQIKSRKLASHFQGQVSAEEIASELQEYVRRLALMFDPENGVPWLNFATALVHRRWTPVRIMQKLRTIGHQSNTLRKSHRSDRVVKSCIPNTIRADEVIDFANVPAKADDDSKPAITSDECGLWMTIAGLTPLERTVLNRINGLGGDQVTTRKRLQKELNLSYQQIKSIEEMAMDKLRKHEPPVI